MQSCVAFGHQDPFDMINVKKSANIAVWGPKNAPFPG